jgi:RimJ/RimL family protein N-acetyltransferase
VINQAIEGGSADIHYVVWDHSLDLHKQRQPAAELFDYLFYQRKVHHVVGFIPSNNQRAIRFAQSVGMKFEGEIRENFKYEGRYYATHIYGVLEREYENFRARLV